jgi:adenylate cyclase
LTIPRAEFLPSVEAAASVRDCASPHDSAWSGASVRAMGAKLHIQPAQGESFEVPISGTATIGRTRENTVWLRESPLVSRQHAIIRCHDTDQYQLVDLGSRNGVYVNDKRVIMPVFLEHGARIRIADNAITFYEVPEDATEEHLQATMIHAGDNDAVEDTNVALLVCDIRAFSTMSEKTAAGDVAQLLGAWFRETANVVARVGGTLDKFIGDALLAYWGSTTNAKLNCGAAFAATKQIVDLAAARTWPDGTPFRIALALHHGAVSCSNVGISAARDATIVGDAVNTVFRLEATAKALDQQVVLSGDFAGYVPGMAKFKDFGERELKGKSQLVRVFGWES